MLSEGPLFHKPKSVIAAKNILYATLFLAVINWAIAQWATDLHPAFVPGFVTLILTLVIIFMLVKMFGQGKKWARVVLLVLFVLGLLFFPWTLPALFKANVLVGAVTILQTILDIIALVFLFSRESTLWFDRVHLVEQDEPAPEAKH